MPHAARNIVLTTLVVIWATSALASRRHLRRYHSNPRPPYVGGGKNYRAGASDIFPRHDASRWPSNTNDCLRPEVHDTPTWYLHDGRFYDKNCLKSLAYFVEPEERAACRSQSDRRYSRGYDNECLVKLSFDYGFDFDFEEMTRQELEWKKSVCHGNVIGQCGRGHSSWWRSRFPSSRDDCRIIGQTDDKGRNDPSDNWVPWSVGPRGTLYDNDCLSRFANRLGMEKPSNCTQTDTQAIHEAREAPPTKPPKTIVYATSPIGIPPRLEFPTRVTTYTPTPEDSITGTIPEPLTTSIPNGPERKRNDISPPLVRMHTETADTLPTSLPLVSRTQDSATDEWSCIWNVDIILPDRAPGMFYVASDDATVDGILSKPASRR